MIFRIILFSCRIQYASEVDSIPLDWALGAFILQSAADLNVENYDWLSPVIGGESSSHLHFFFGIFLVVVLVSWILLRRKNPQLKTIYDLEKGKYITTRISRYS